MKAILLTLLLISYLYSDFTIKYLINGTIKQTVFYKDKEHVLFQIEDNNKILEKLYIVDSKKYLTFEEGGIEHIYEISDELSDNSVGSKEKDLNYTIVEKEGNITYGEFNASKWLIKDSDELKEEVIVTNNVNFYEKLQNTIEALKRILPANKESDASIFNMGSGYVLLQSEHLKFLSYKKEPIELSLFHIDNSLNTQEQELLSQKIDKCFNSVCCGNRAESSKELYKFLKDNNKSWKLMGVGECKENSQKELESAIYKYSDKFITVEMTAKNSMLGKIDSLEQKGIKIKDVENSMINGYKIKTAYLPNVDATIADIILPNTTISIYTKGKENLKSIANEIIQFNVTALSN